MPDTITTGIPHVDDLLSGLYIGENVVWETDAGCRHDIFINNFIRSALDAGQMVVYVSFNRSPATMHQVLSEFMDNEKFLLVDCFTAGKGKNDPVFQHYYEKGKGADATTVRKVNHPADPDLFLEEINRIEDECGEGPRYIFDSLTGMQDIWGDETRAYKFFTYTCPRLFDLKTIAYWIVERDAHTASFFANIRHVTQVVVALSREKGQNSLQIIKADGRSIGPLHSDQHYEVTDNNVSFVDLGKKQLSIIGERIRVARLSKRLSQAELGRMLGVTGSTISQAENGLISLSLQHIINLARALEVYPSQFFDDGPHLAEGGAVLRKNAQVEVFPAGTPIPGLSIKALRPDDTEADFSIYIVEFEASMKLDEHFFTTKRKEFGYVLSGKLQIMVGKVRHELEAGDGIFLEEDAPSGWRNLSDDKSLILWICMK